MFRTVATVIPVVQSLKESHVFCKSLFKSRGLFLVNQEYATLAFEEVLCSPKDITASQQPKDVLVMHGLLGSARNWRSFAKALGDNAARQTGLTWRMLLLDLRCHGASSRIHGIHPPHSMETAARDVLDFMSHHLGTRRPAAILGHSMGGKVLMELLRQMQHHDSLSHNDVTGHHQHQRHTSSDKEAHQHPLLPRHAWVLDSQPGMVPASTDAETGVARVLQTINDIQVPVPSRQWLQDFLKQRGYDKRMSDWLASNLTQDGHGHLVWAFDKHGVGALYHSYRSSDYWPVLKIPPHGCTVHLVRGGRSDRWPAEQLQGLQATIQHHSQHAAQHSTRDPRQQHQASSCGKFELHMLQNAGHWLHADDPAGLMKLIVPYLSQA